MLEMPQQPIDYTTRYQIRSGRVNFANYVQRRQLIQDGVLLGLNLLPPDNDASIVPNIQEGAANTTPAEYAEYLAEAVAEEPTGPTVPAAPTNLVATAGDGEASIAFTAPSDGGSPITNYEYWITDASGGGFEPFSPPVTTSPVIITGLPNGQTLHIRLRAVNAVGPGASSEIVTVTPVGPPEAPYGLTATPGNAQVVITFSQGSDGGSAIMNYQYSTDDGATFRAFSPVDITSPVTITKLSTNGVTNLTNGTSYTIRLKAVNAVGISDASDPVSSTPSTTPSPPTSLSGTPGDKQIEVSFTAGANGGSAITNYQYSTDNGATYLAFSPADTTSPVTITKLSSNGTTDLTNGVAYTVRLKAVNSNGASTQSSSISVTPILITEPPAPTSLSGVAGNQAIYVLFTQSGNGGRAITNYEYSTDNGVTFRAFNPAQTFSPVAITAASSDGTTTLTNGTGYTVKLKAVNSVGASVESASITVTPTTTTLNTTSLVVELDANNSSSYSGSGTTWTNLRSSGSYSASLQNGPTFDGTNKYFTFDGDNQIAQIAAAAAINPTIGSSFTVQIWARVNTSSPNFAFGDGLISKQYGPGSYDGYSLSLRPDTSLYLKMNGSSVDGTYSSPTGVYSNGWSLYTIVVRFGGGSGNPSYTYVSTRRVVTGDNSDGGIPSNNAPIQFPRGIQESTFNFCPADVGAFYLYNTAVSQEDIIRNYDATKSRYGL